MRSKEEAHDYRYFPEPDLLPLMVDEAWIEEIKVTLLELPAEKRERFVREYGIPAYDAGVLTATKELANYYESSTSLFNKPKVVSNWVMGELLRLLKEDSKDITQPSTFSLKPLQNFSRWLTQALLISKLQKRYLKRFTRQAKNLMR